MGAGSWSGGSATADGDRKDRRQRMVVSQPHPLGHPAGFLQPVDSAAVDGFPRLLA